MNGLSLDGKESVTIDTRPDRHEAQISITTSPDLVTLNSYCQQLATWVRMTACCREGWREEERYKYPSAIRHQRPIPQLINTLPSNQLHKPTLSLTPNQSTKQPTNTSKMQFTTFAITAFAALASAAAIEKRAPIDLCPAIDTPPVLPAGRRRCGRRHLLCP